MSIENITNRRHFFRMDSFDAQYLGGDSEGDFDHWIQKCLELGSEYMELTYFYDVNPMLLQLGYQMEYFQGDRVGVSCWGKRVADLLPGKELTQIFIRERLIPLGFTKNILRHLNPEPFYEAMKEYEKVCFGFNWDGEENTLMYGTRLTCFKNSFKREIGLLEEVLDAR